MVRSAVALHALAWLAVIAIGGVTLAAVAGLFGGDGIVRISVQGDAGGRTATLLCVLASGGLTVAGLLQLVALTRAVRGDETFGARSIRHLRRFAGFMAAAGASNVLLPSIAALVFPAAGTARVLRLEATGGDLAFLLLTLVLWWIARLFELASRFESDSKGIV